MKEEQLYPHERSMILYNEVPCLLPVNIRYVDELVRVEYDISGMQPLSTAFSRQGLTKDWMTWLIEELVKAQNSLIEYMLSPDGMLLSPEYIFTDSQKSKLLVCYQPGEREHVEKNVQPLLQYILENVDYTDQTSVKLAYALYHVHDETGDIITTMKKCLNTENHELSSKGAYDLSSDKEIDRVAEERPKKGIFYKLFNRDSKRELLLTHAMDDEELKEG